MDEFQARLPGQCFLVGGAVRDALLGAQQGAPGDRDWVVVGCSPQAMLDAGFRPVGRDFPVFLHPLNQEEYALARTERKSAPGYHGFSFHAAPDVTLVQDLARRDLTVNAMALGPDGQLIDPYNGAQDLQNGVLRHVSLAFAEDPVRLLRLARFAARWPHFSVAPETHRQLQQLVDAGEVDALVPERVWQELARGLMETGPRRMIEVLRDCGALARLLPELDGLWGVPQPPAHHPEIDTGVHQLLVLDAAARAHASLPARWACLMHDLGKGSTPQADWPRHIGHEQRSVKLARQVAERLRVPVDCRETAEVVAREHGHVHRSLTLGAEATLRLLERCDALRRPARFADALLACECDARGRAGLQAQPYPQRARLARALDVVRAVDSATITQAASDKGLSGPAVGAALRQARTQALCEDQAWLGLGEGQSAVGDKGADSAS